ncbi:hypothetical protein [Rhizosphaericola mali]|uniref:Site-specific recombinase n=1 Tax=Rhizosphaericola mali TaxID=2545455 RepID=A0A5P2G7H6_9BACT|nr:hypothetical protein [Rhizosphaericola mali]QES89163.1 hypothetical protein E0W69_010985 [Rhizosphaericola mali]
MALLKKKDKKRKDLIEATLLEDYKLDFLDEEAGLEFLVDFFQRIRPIRLKYFYHSDELLIDMNKQLVDNQLLLSNVRSAFLSQLLNTNLVPALTESGLYQSQGFGQEFTKRMTYKLLPPLQEKGDFLYVLNHIFYNKGDYLWVQNIPRQIWINFFEIIGFKGSSNNASVTKQLLKSTLILSYRVANLGLDKELVNYLDENVKGNRNNPFVLQNLISVQLETVLKEEPSNVKKINDLLKDLEDMLLASISCLQDVQKNQSENGASVSLTFTTFRLESFLDRMRILVDSMNQDEHLDTGKFVDLFRLLVRNEKRKSSIRELFSQTLGYVAYQIAEHKGTKGGKYITTTAKAWWKMIYTAAWGGVIICFIAFFKLLLHLLNIPPFWQGIAYSINYSVGFVAIEETHSTLATKQPAFTASAVASSLDSKKNVGNPNLYQLAVTVARVMRSQNASFIGNLMIVIPGSYLLAFLYDKIKGHKILEGVHALDTLQDQHPWHSFSLLYACNAGVFLFLTGLLAGYVGNKMKYEHVAKRIVQHPILSLTMSKTRLEKLGNYIEHHSGAMAGNIAFGFLMGMSSVVTQIFGINFDVRHVTIASANVAIGCYGLGFENIQPRFLWELALGIFGIGFFNFAISFSLAFYVALRSRGIKMREYPEFIKILWHYFRKHPLRFLFPPKESSLATDKQ